VTAFVFLLLGLALKLTAGSLSVWLTRPLWAAYWRRRECSPPTPTWRASARAPRSPTISSATCSSTSPPPYMAGREHPYAELRIDRLLRATEALAVPGTA
jgi:hypothetical protein